MYVVVYVTNFSDDSEVRCVIKNAISVRTIGSKTTVRVHRSDIENGCMNLEACEFDVSPANFEGFQFLDALEIKVEED